MSENGSDIADVFDAIHQEVFEMSSLLEDYVWHDLTPRKTRDLYAQIFGADDKRVRHFDELRSKYSELCGETVEDVLP